MFVFCDDTTCRFNLAGSVCLAKELRITVGTGTRDDLTIGPINVCSNYEETDNGRDDD